MGNEHNALEIANDCLARTSAKLKSLAVFLDDVRPQPKPTARQVIEKVRDEMRNTTVRYELDGRGDEYGRCETFLTTHNPISGGSGTGHPLTIITFWADALDRALNGG